MSGDGEGSVYEISRRVLFVCVCIAGVYNVILHGNAAAGCMRSRGVYYLCVCVYIAGVCIM